MFFILSGFIMTYTYKDCKFSALTCCRAFWWRRIARIFPSHEVALCLAVIQLRCLWEGTCFSIVEIPTTILLVQEWLPAWIDGWNPPSWTLSIEMLFYFFFPLLVHASYKRFLPWVVIWCLLPTLVGAVVDPDRFFSDDDYLPFFFRRFILLRLADFTLGIHMGQIALEHGAKWLSAEGQVSVRFWLCRFAPALVALILFVLPFADPHKIPILFSGSLIAPFFAPLILGLGIWDTNSWLGAFLAWRPIYLFGKISFAFYLVHFSFPPYFDTLIDSSVFNILWFLTSVGVAAMLHLLVEQPVYGFLIRWQSVGCVCRAADPQ